MVSEGALAGLVVIDLTRVLGGPYCTQILGDHGAEVIKVEPPQGDEVRDWGPPFNEARDASYFVGVNRNKRSLGLDLGQPAGRAVLLRLLERADVVIVSAERLLETKSRHNPNVHLVTHGVDVEHFRRACRPETAVPAELAALPRPVVGFFGLVADWVDLELLRGVAAARPEWSLVLLGKVDTDAGRLAALPNVHLLGRKSYESLPGYCKGFDVAVLPFAINELTLAANPLKLREYLAAGLPVVATPIPEVERLGELVRTGRDAPEFVARIEELLAAGRRGPDLEISRRMDVESWDEKVRRLGEIVAAAGRRPKARAS